MSQQTPYAPVAPVYKPKNGLGTAGMVLGIIGVVLSLFVVLFWISGPLGILALIFGIVGLGRVKKGEATNKGAAITGLVLGIVATLISAFFLVSTVIFVDAVSDEIDKLEKDATATAPKDPSEGKGEAPKEGELLALGDGMEFEDGLVATITKVEKYTPGEFAVGHEKGNDAYQVTVEIDNASKENVDLALGTVDATAGKEGAPAEAILEEDNIGMFEGSVAAGKKTTQTFNFSVPSGTENLVVEVAPSFDYDSVFWDLKL
jgi:hypothetical protein